ncbi:MAG: CoA ester lyase [Desulfobacterales bacterium]|nr:MAG: CoA ester lyase [Desulfobacterales bacterium]
MKPRRSILSVPGHVKKMHVKSSAGDADIIMLDLEDSVPVDAKQEARRTVISSIREIDWGGRAISVRINSLDTPFAWRDLTEVAREVGTRVDSIVVPKVNHPGDIHFVDRLLDGIELETRPSRPLTVEASIETAEGLKAAPEIASASGRLISLVFGIADYSASVGARLVSISGHGEKEEEIYPGHRWHFPLSRMIMAAKASGLLAIDAPFGNFRDDEGLRRNAAMACAIGCDGKWAIHPAQTAGINEIFSPSPEDIERARKVLAAADAALDAGRGAVAVDGRMVDQATVRLAAQLVAKARHLGMI